MTTSSTFVDTSVDVIKNKDEKKIEHIIASEIRRQTSEKKYGEECEPIIEKIFDNVKMECAIRRPFDEVNLILINLWTYYRSKYPDSPFDEEEKKNSIKIYNENLRLYYQLEDHFDAIVKEEPYKKNFIYICPITHRFTCFVKTEDNKYKVIFGMNTDENVSKSENEDDKNKTLIYM